jgi:carbon monoxide dehydrogenase subunit G
MTTSEVTALITIAEEIPVPVSSGQVWKVVSDPSEVVSCISGAELGESHEDGSFDGTLVVKFGAVRVRFAARVSLELNESELEGRLTAQGRDGQAATRFSAHATFRVSEDEQANGSRVRVDGEIKLAGKLASLIESGASAVVSRMTKEFSEELVRRCAGDEAATAPAPRRSWWAVVLAWWHRIIHKGQIERTGVTSGKAQ